MSSLEETQKDTQLRTLIREHARGQEGYDARLYDLWEEWNDTFFGGLMTYSLIQLTDPGNMQRYGCCSTYSGLAGIRSSIKIRPSILEGTPLGLKHGNPTPGPRSAAIGTCSASSLYKQLFDMRKGRLRGGLTTLALPL